MEIVSSGAKILDEFLEGGYPINCITSIYGPAGSGRTLLSAICAINIAKDKKVVYIDADKKFSISRLVQINHDKDKITEILKLRIEDKDKEMAAQIKILNNILHDKHN